MKIVMASLFAFCVTTKGSSQDPHTVDSLSKLLQATSDETVKALAVGELARRSLSLSCDIIKAHGGEITVETKEREGTVFMAVLFVE